MIYLYPNVAYSGRTQIIINDKDHLPNEEKGLVVEFTLNDKLSKRDAIKELNQLISKSDLEWIFPRKSAYLIDLDVAKSKIVPIQRYEWLWGNAVIKPELEYKDTEIFGESAIETVVSLCIYMEEFILSQNTKIFLSHKGEDKVHIRQFNQTLKEIGFKTWLDEEVMIAGTELERGLLKGMKESCAAVFFITPDFKDEGYLATEINYAMAEKREKNDRFSIITMILKDKDGKKGKVPDLLKQYVYKEPKTDLECLQEIIKALPVYMETLNWKV